MSFWEYLGTTLLGAGVASGLLSGMVAFQLERFKNRQSGKLEEIKAELSVIAKLQGQAVERQATIAAQVLVTTLRYLDALRSSVTGLAQLPPGKSDTPSSALKAELEFRWAALRPFEKDFLDVWIQAQVHLPEDASTILAEVSECGNHIYGSQITHLTMFANGSPNVTAFENGFGRKPRDRIDALRETALAKLRPLVKLELRSAIESATLPNVALNPTGADAPAG
jgi:hypothetical protein